MAQLVVLGLGVPEPPPGPLGEPALVGSTTRAIRVVTAKGSEGYDLTDAVEGLQWSSVNPGGDERATFRLKRRWFAGAPEIAEGNVLRIMAGLDVLWQGQVHENDRAVAQAEEIGVVAYGMGARLKDNNMQEVYVDRDLSRWGPSSVQRRLVAASIDYVSHDPTVVQDTTTGEPALEQRFNARWGATAAPANEAWYDGHGLLLDSIYFAWKKNINVDPAGTDTNWSWTVETSTDDLKTLSDGSTTNLRAAGPGTGTRTATGNDKRFGMVQLRYDAGNTGVAEDSEYALWWTCLAVYGAHGLTKRGSEDATHAKGFWASDIVTDIVGRTPGVVARQIDATSFVIEQLEFREPVKQEQAVVDTSKYDARDWGTWGPDNVFDNSDTGYFDWTARDSATQHWYIERANCDDVDFHTEITGLYDTVDVSFTDPSGKSQIVTRTTAVPALDEADMSPRTFDLPGGTLTAEMAQQLGDAFLALSSAQAPARGSATITGPVAHYQRGLLPPYYMRADGSNLRIPDTLPSKDLFSLSAAPDRRTTFPIRRVDHDASGAAIKTRVDIDQSLDLLSILQARVTAGVELVG